jgi:hypothetical protein
MSDASALHNEVWTSGGTAPVARGEWSTSRPSWSNPGNELVTPIGMRGPAVVCRLWRRGCLLRPHRIQRPLLAHPPLSVDTILTELSLQITVCYIASLTSGLHTIARMIMNSVFWDVASCRLVDGYKGFRRTCCSPPPFLGWKNRDGQGRIFLRLYDCVTNNKGFWIGWLDFLTPSFRISLNHNQL